MSGVVTPLQAAATTGAGTVLAIPSSFRNHSFTITGTGTVSAGAVTIEASMDNVTWAPLIPVAGTTANPNPATVVSGVDVLINYVGILNFVRGRISTTVTGAGGSVSVNYYGGKNY